MKMHREQLALDKVGLRRLAQPDGNVGLPHRQVEFFFGGNQRDTDVGKKIEKFAQPRHKPMHADARRRGYLQFAVRALAGIGELGARRFELHEHFMRGPIQQFALLGEDQAARMAVKQGNGQLASSAETCVKPPIVTVPAVRRHA